jgi:hypothetical protein
MSNGPQQAPRPRPAHTGRPWRPLLALLAALVLTGVTVPASPAAAAGPARASCKNVYSGSTRVAYVCVRADGLGSVYGTATRYVSGMTSLTLTECGGPCPSRTTSISTISTSARTQSLSDRYPSYYYYTRYSISWYGHNTVSGYTNAI